MSNYYTSHHHLARSLNSALLTIVSFMLAFSFANAQTCPDPGGGVFERGFDFTTASSATLFPQSVPSGQTGIDHSTVGRMRNLSAVTTVFPSNVITINPMLTNGHTGSVVLFFRNLWFGNAPNAELKIYRGTSTSGTLVATINAADSTTYTQTSMSYTGPVTLQFQSPVAGTSGNFDIHLRYWTGDQVFQSGFQRLAAVWTDFIQPDSYTFVDDQRSTVPNAPYSLNTNPISIAHFDANRNFVSAELAFCANSPLHNIGYLFNGGDYPGRTMFTKRISYTVDRDGAVNPSSNPLKIARLVWLMANRTTVPTGSLRGTNDEVWSIVNSTNSTGGGAETAVPSLPTPNEPTFSITSGTPASPGNASNFTVNFDMAGSYAKRLKLVVPTGVTISSVTGTGVTYSGGFINFATLPGTATIQAVSATPRTADLRVVYDESGFYNTTNMSLYVSCRAADVQTFLGMSQGQETHPYREASATWQSADFDYGDLPDSYATVTASNGPSHAIIAYNVTTHTSSLMLGSQIDSEADGVAGTVANGDNLAGVNDEDAIKQFPVLTLAQTTYSVTVPVTNTTGADATVRGWIDFNRDGVFGPGEEATQTVADGGTSVTLTWPSFTAAATAGTVYARFRIASVASEITSPTGAANSGEVEDYRLFIGVTVAGTVFNDINSNRIIESGENFTSLPVPMYVYMVNSNVIVDAATVATNGSYLLTAPANGTSTVHLSTQQYAIGTDIGTNAIDHTPPTNWTRTGENAGGNNNATTNDSNADGILSVTVTNANLVNRNFGIRQLSAGTSGAYDICASDRSVMPLSEFISGQDLGGTWSYVSGSGITFDPVAGTIQLTSAATTSTYRYDLGGNFSIATVRVRQLPVKTQNITICQGQSYCLTNPVGNARVIGSGETFCHTTTGVYTDTLSLAGQYGCDSIVVTTLTVIPTPNAGTDGSVAACNNSTSPINLFDLITGEQTGGVWARLTGSGGTFNAVAGTFTPATGATNSTFSYTITAPNSCGVDQSVASVNINICTIQIAGGVWNDGNGNAVKNAGEAPVSGNNTNNGGASVATGGNLYANLVDGNNNVLQSVQVNADGSFVFAPVGENLPYKVILTTTAQTVSTSLSTGSGPTNWLPTGTSLNGSPNVGNSSYVIDLGTVSANITNADFGINRLPESNNVTHILATQPLSGTEVLLDGTDAPLVNGSDPEDGTYSGETGTPNNDPRGVVITSLPTNGELWYYGFGVPVVVSATDVANGTLFAEPSLFSVILTGTGYTSTTFEYAYVDAAGAIDPTPATYTISWEKPLPVTLISFNVTAESQTANLKWITSSETNSEGFEIQRSGDAVNWTKIGYTESQNSNSKSQLTYNFSDALPLRGTSYYRLKMLDLDGKFAYSRIVSVNIKGETAYVWPNPSAGTIKLSDLNLSEVKMVELVNASGKVIYRAQQISANGIDVKGVAGNGFYVLVVNYSDGSRTSHKIVIGN